MSVHRSLGGNSRFALPAVALALLSLVAGLVVFDLAESAQEPNVAAPFRSLSTEEAPPPLCRFGVNATDDIGVYDTSPLRLGWYVNFHASAAAGGPAGANFVPIIRLEQTGPNSYEYTPNGGALLDAIAANPSADWLIGNEPDRRFYQDSLEPHLYAAAYHELYTLIKDADADARVFAGTIVQPTPLRLQYLDLVLESYRETFDEPMPVDGWSIHNFILNEVSCAYDDTNCTGAEVPPGIDAPYGEILTIEDHDRMDLFVERIRRFRQWMADRGYHGLPLYNSEYGILIPYPHLGNFPPARVNAFMDDTFDYMMGATDPLLGDPEDEFRLIQKWSWYSNSDTSFNGWLFDPQSKALTGMGQNYAAYVSPLEAEVDLYPSRISAEPTAPFTQGEPLTFTLRAVVANSGNVVTSTAPFVVRFYDGDPAGGGIQIGGDQLVSLTGCGDNESVEMSWSNVPAGAHQVYVTVDGDGLIEESDELNNQGSQVILVASERIFLTPLTH
jgi:hypothetical protein